MLTYYAQSVRDYKNLSSINKNESTTSARASREGNVDVKEFG